MDQRQQHPAAEPLTACTVVWRTRNAETIRRIRQRFRLPPGMTVNRETPALLPPGDMELLREVERRGFVQVRFKGG